MDTQEAHAGYTSTRQSHALQKNRAFDDAPGQGGDEEDRKRLAPAPGEPPSTWRSRRIEWVTGPLPAIREAIPELVSTPLVNEMGVEHRLSAQMACRWPRGGELTTPERCAWSNTATGIGPAWPPPVQPIEALTAFERLVTRSPGRHPMRWTLGITDDGEWYTLRASWPRGHRRIRDRARLERYAVLEHATYQNVLRLNAGVRDAGTGAQIGMYWIPTRVEAGRMTDPSGLRSCDEHCRTILKMADTAEKILESWDLNAADRTTAEQWADLYAAPVWGPGAAKDAAASGRGRTTPLSAAWSLAQANARMTDVEERSRLAEHLGTIVEELARRIATDRPDHAQPEHRTLTPATVH